MLDARNLEEIVIGAAISSPRVYSQVERILSADMFTERWIRDVWQVVADLHFSNRHVDIAVVCRRLDDRDFDYSARLVLAAHKAADETEHIPDYAREIADANRRRRAYRLGEWLMKKAKDGGSAPHEMLAEAAASIDSITAADVSSERTLREVTEHIYQGVETALSGGSPPGIETGVHTIDQMLGRIQPTDFIVLGGDSGSGKTALATQIALEVSLRKRVLFFALDQPWLGIGQRITSRWSGCTMQQLREAQMDIVTQEAIAEIPARAAAHDLIFVDQPRMTVEDIRARVLAHSRTGENRLGLVIIDHLKKVRTRRSHRNEFDRIAEVIDELRELTSEARVPIILLGQRTRSSQHNDSNPEPRRGDLYGGGSIDEAADIVLMTWRPERNESWLARRRDEDELAHQQRLRLWQNRAQLILDKHRSKDVPMKRTMVFDGAQMIYREVDA